MLKLVKYEVRRNRNWMIIVLLAAIALQGYFLGASYLKNEEHMVMSGMFLVMATVFVVYALLIAGVSMYSRELSAKSSYLTFMTPNSATKILGAKVLTVAFLCVGFAALLMGFAAWDYQILRGQYPQLNMMFLLSQFNMRSVGIDMTIQEVIWMLVQFGMGAVVTFFTTVMIAYLAITLSATVLQNKKFKWLISGLLFAAIFFGMQWVMGKIPMTGNYSSMQAVLRSLIPHFLLELGVMIVSFFLSAWLLEKKVSL